MSRSEHARAALGAAACAAVLLVAGCATPAPQPAPADARSWLGRFAVTWVADTLPPTEERASGRFALRELGQRTELEVFSPFGQTVARATSDPEVTVLETANGRRYQADNPEALTEEVLGWRAPVRSLPGWLAAGGPDQVVEDGWEVRVDSRDEGQPRRLTLRWPAGATTSTGRPVTIRLVLDRPGDLE